jgi:hypothetical protein
MQEREVLRKRGRKVRGGYLVVLWSRVALRRVGQPKHREAML